MHDPSQWHITKHTIWFLHVVCCHWAFCIAVTFSFLSLLVKRLAQARTSNGELSNLAFVYMYIWEVIRQWHAWNNLSVKSSRQVSLFTVCSKINFIDTVNTFYQRSKCAKHLPNLFSCCEWMNKSKMTLMCHGLQEGQDDSICVRGHYRHWNVSFRV